MKHLLFTLSTRFLIIAVVVGAVGTLVYARSGEVGTTEATYSVGGIDLKIDSAAFYNDLPYLDGTWSAKNLQPYHDQFFDFEDVKPGDRGTTTISVHVKKSSAWVCLAFDNFKNKENGRNEPELLEDGSSLVGELGDGLEFFAWFDDGDNRFEIGEKPLFGTSTQEALKTVKNKTYALADYKHGPAWAKNSVHYVGISWCAGDLSVNLQTGAVSCSGEALGNEAQTDSLSFSVSLEAVPPSQDKKFLCSKSKAGHGHHDDDDDDDHDHDDDEYSWYDWGDEDGWGGSCNVGKRT